MIINIIQKKVSIGDELSVFLKDGTEIRGNLTEIEESYLEISNIEGEETILEEMIGRFKVHTKNQGILTSPDVASDSPTNLEKPNQEIPIHTNSQITSLGNTTPTFFQPPEPSGSTTLREQNKTENVRNFSVEVIDKMEGIENTFQVGIKTAKPGPDPINFAKFDEIPNFPTKKQDIEIRKVWDRARNQYNHAMKLGELHRLKPILMGLNELLNKFPNLSSVRFNVGCLHLELGEFDKAISTFEIATSNSQEPRFFHNLAIAALLNNQAEKACYAMLEFFRKSSLSAQLQLWYKFLELTLSVGDIKILTEMLKKALQEQNDEDASLILRSAAYILKVSGRAPDAYEIVALLLKNFDMNQAILLLRSALNKIKHEPTYAYLNQEQELCDIQAKQSEFQKQQEAKSIRDNQVKRLLDEAQRLAVSHPNFNVLAKVREARKLDPTNKAALELESRYTKPKRQYTPKSKSDRGGELYKKARVVHERKNFQLAEKYYREAISHNDRKESAIKDLASLLQQKRTQEDTKEAIKILEKYRPQMYDQASVDNMLVVYYRLDERYHDVIELSRKIYPSATNDNRRVELLRNIAYCQYKLGEVENLERTVSQVLRLRPNNVTAQSWLDNLKKAQKSGYQSLDEFFAMQDSLPDFGTEISDFFRFYLERCEYEGAYEDRISSRNFSEEDVEKLNGFIRRTGKARPSVRAQYSLSAAKILEDLKAEERRVRSFLRNFATDMGDSIILEGKQKDVVLAYYAEAFMVAPEWNQNLSEKRFSRLIMLFFTTSTREEIMSDNVADLLEKYLIEALTTNKGREVVELLFELSLSRAVAEYLLSLINGNQRLKNTSA
ncbi:TPR repeat containing protein [Beggiatoa sp. PS]|nr:TPR repeat containing protein [Beggiatoa sp. PS]